MRVNKVNTDSGVELHFSVEKCGIERPWLVFVLPFGLEVSSAAAFFTAFQGQFNVLTWQCRLILSDEELKQGQDSFSISQHVNDLNVLLNDQGVERVILVGYCSGAGVSLAYAAAHKDMISQLVLINGDYVILDEADCVTQHGKDVDSLFPLAAMDQKKSAFVLDRINQSDDDGERARLGLNKPFSSPLYFQRYAMNYLSYKEANFKELAKSIEHPVLVIASGMDKQANVTSSKRIVECLQNAEFYLDANADHYEPLREGSHILAYLYDYLSRINYDGIG
ncbi:alpha/beta hydrolase [Teredinibacter turnerae]|uniref:alpha/beta fold hydrolase n=1 Tax=Teredinibacter turnerae TaxID=2426 RepID=UPI0030D1AC46